MLKGILHPADAEKAVALGADGILVSNHGGRQIDSLPPAIDCLPAIVKAVGGRATVLIDSGIRSGVDVARALALGASAALSGKAFLWGLGVLGTEGPGHVMATWHTHTSRQAAYMLFLPNGHIPAQYHGHRHSAGFPSRRKPQGAWPPDRAPFLSRPWPSPLNGGKGRDEICLVLSGGLHAFVMFIAPILSSFVAHHFRVRAGHPLPCKTGGGAATRGVV